MWGKNPNVVKNPLIKSSYYYSIFQQRESTKFKYTSPIQSQINPVKFCSQLQSNFNLKKKLNFSQSNRKTPPLELDQR